MYQKYLINLFINDYYFMNNYMPLTLVMFNISIISILMLYILLSYKVEAGNSGLDSCPSVLIFNKLKESEEYKYLRDISIHIGGGLLPENPVNVSF